MNYGWVRFLRELKLVTKKSKHLLCFGDDEYAKSMARVHWRKCLKSLHGDVDVEDTLTWGKDTETKVQLALTSIPMLSDCRRVEIEIADGSKCDRLYSLLQEAAPEAHIFVTWLGEDRPASEFLEKNTGIVSNSLNPDSGEFDKFADFCLSGTGKRLSKDALSWLKSHLRADQVYCELKKASWITLGEEISLDGIQQVCGSSSRSDVFSLVEAIMLKQPQQAIAAFSALKGEVDPILIIHLITQRLQLLDMVRQAQERSENVKDFFLRKKLPLFQLPFLMQAVNNFRPGVLEVKAAKLAVLETQLRSMRGRDSLRESAIVRLIVDL